MDKCCWKTLEPNNEWIHSQKGSHLCSTHCIVSYIWVANEGGFLWARLLIIPTHDCAARREGTKSGSFTSRELRSISEARRGGDSIWNRPPPDLQSDLIHHPTIHHSVQLSIGITSVELRRSHLFSSRVHVPVVFNFIFNKIPGTRGLQIVNGFMALPVVCRGSGWG